jgi:hypothetical protein
MQAVPYCEMSVNCFQCALFNIPEEYNNGTVKPVGRHSSVGIANRYWFDSPGIESLWGNIFRTRPEQNLRPTQPSVQWVPGLFPRR